MLFFKNVQINTIIIPGHKTNDYLGLHFAKIHCDLILGFDFVLFYDNDRFRIGIYWIMAL